MVHSESQENGEKETKRSRHEELEEGDPQGDREMTTRAHEEKMDTSFPGAVETQSPSHTSHDVETNTGNGSITRWPLSSFKVIKNEFPIFDLDIDLS